MACDALGAVVLRGRAARHGRRRGLGWRGGSRERRRGSTEAGTRGGNMMWVEGSRRVWTFEKEATGRGVVVTACH